MDSISFIPCSLSKLLEAFGLTATWYPHFLNTNENLDYVGKILDISFYGVNEMSAFERKYFLVWYQVQNSEVFDNRRVLETYSQDDITVLRQACQVFRRNFMQIENIDVFLESITIASACNTMLRKWFLKHNTIVLIPTAGYSCNVRQSEKALMWLVHSGKTDGCKILHGRNGREYRLPEHPHRSVDGFCPETRTVYEFCGCFYSGHTCIPFRDVSTGSEAPWLNDMNIG